MTLWNEISCTKKIAASFFLIVAGFPFLLLLTFFVKKETVQHKMKEALETKTLQTIQINTAEINWEKPGKEIRIGNRLFDIKEAIQSGKQTIITGLYDDEETETEQQIANTAGNQKQTKTTGFICSLLQQVYFSRNSYSFIPCFFNTNSMVYSEYKTLFYSTAFAEVPTPPPLT